MLIAAASTARDLEEGGAQQEAPPTQEGGVAVHDGQGQGGGGVAMGVAGEVDPGGSGLIMKSKPVVAAKEIEDPGGRKMKSLAVLCKK